MQLTLKPTFKQHLVYEALKDPSVDTVFFGGGAGGGKSWLICESRLVNALLNPGYKSFIGREELKRLMQSTYLTWCKVSQHHDLPKDTWHLNGQYNYIEFKNGSRIDLLDLKFLPSDPLYERFGSLEYTDGAIEEAGEVDFLAFDVLRSRVGRHLNRETGVRPTFLITGNPKKNWTYAEFYKPWKKGELPGNARFVQALFRDNQHTAEDYGKQLQQIKDVATKERLMFGNWEYDDDPTALMRYDAITDLFTNNVDVDPQKYLSADIARFGGDLIPVYLWEGLKLTKIWIWRYQSIHDTVTKLRSIAMEERVPYSHVVVDEDGMGGGVVDAMDGIKGFVANSAPLDFAGNRQNFQNLKAQCTYKLAEYVNAHRIAVRLDVQEAPNMTPTKIKEMLVEELEQVKSKDADKDGRLKIVGKDEIKEKIGRSPDLCDALMMRMYFEIEPAFGSPAEVKANFATATAYRYGSSRMGAVRNGPQAW